MVSDHLKSLVLVAVLSATVVTGCAADTSSQAADGPSQATSSADVGNRSNQPSAPTVVNFVNKTNSTFSVYYMTDLYQIEVQPYDVCNYLSVLTSWSKLSVPKNSTGTVLTSSESGPNLCIGLSYPVPPSWSLTPTGPNPASCGYKDAAPTTPGDGSYSGPYFVQNTGSGLFLQQNWTKIPSGSAGNINCFGGDMLQTGQSWAPGNDYHGMRFTYTGNAGSSPQLTVVINQAAPST